MRPKEPPIPAPAHIASSSTSNGSGDSQITVSKPGGTVDNDLMVAFIMANGVTVSSPPGGWTQQVFQPVTLDSNNGWLYCYTKIAASEPGSYNWNMNGGFPVDLASISTYRPASSSQPEAANSGQISGNTSTHTALNITTTHAETLIIAAYFLNRSGTNTSAVNSPPSGMTNRVNVTGQPFSRPDFQMVTYDEVLSAAGLYTGKTLTSNPNTWAGGITIGLRALGT
jgi:hypothetical protein